MAMIEVKNLTKYYGSFLAANNITFDVPKGDIVGILGPNGAGKTTVIRILTCFMPATSGRASIGGFDIFTQSLEVRKTIGYMPESVPLSDDLRVDEYLTFRGQLKGLERSTRRKRVDEVLQRCQLADRRRQLVGTLSKGYRQRVGLAEALLGDPKVLVLDEPTLGLDPGQIREARNLIHGLGQTHTILFSSHILSEVEQICSRIIMIVAGRIAAYGRLDELKQSIAGQGRAVLEARGQDAEGLRRAIAALPGVKNVSLEEIDAGFRSFNIEPAQDGPGRAGDGDVREAVARLATGRNWTIRELHLKQPTLEEFFVNMVAEQNLTQPTGKVKGL